MGFIDLQNRLKQTDKARKGTSNRIDYYSDAESDEEFDRAVYKKALQAANKVVKFYEESGKITSKDKLSVEIKQPKE